MLNIKKDEFDAYSRLNDLAQKGSLQVISACNLGDVEADNIDVLVVAQNSSMADTGCMIEVELAERGLFTRGEKLTVNGISGFIGPAPNERLGIVDVMIAADMVSETDSSYTGADLFFDLMEDREIALHCISSEDTHFEAMTHLGIIPFARFMIFNLFVEPQLATLAKDSLALGSSMIINGGRGPLLGSGSLHSTARPSLSCAVDCFAMDKGLMFPPRPGQVAQNTLTLAIPVWDRENVRPLLDVVTKMVANRSEQEKTVLRRCEEQMVGELASSKFRFVDPGPAPYPTILTPTKRQRH